MSYFAAKKDGSDYVLDVFDFIGSDWMGEGVTAKGVARALADAGEAERIVVRINSPGGEVFEGTAIYNQLRGVAAEKTVRVEVHGLAASMASVIAMAGDEIVMAEGSMMMIHNPWSFAIGDEHEMRKQADLLSKLKDSAIDIYARKSGKRAKQIATMMDDETWMTADEAVENGFATGTMKGSKKAKASANAERTVAMLSRFGKTPEHVLAAYSGAVSESASRPVRAVTEMPAQREEVPSMATMRTEEKPEAPAFDLSMYVPRSEYDAAMGRIAALEAREAAQAKASHDADAKRAVDDALSAGKIAPASEAVMRALCSTPDGLVSFRAFVATAPIIAGPIVDAPKVDPEPAKPKLTDRQRKLAADFNLTEDEYLAAMAKVGE